MYLLDTNVLAEVKRPQPDDVVVDWLNARPLEQLFVSSASLVEIGYGTALLPDGERRDALNGWLEDEFPVTFEGRILPVDEDVARLWGAMRAETEQAGREIGDIECCLAATAKQHSLTLVTGGGLQFEHLDVKLVNPWNGVE